MTVKKNNIILNYMKVKNKKTNRNILLRTAKRYLKEGRININDVVYDQDRLFYNKNRKAFMDKNKPATKKLLKQITEQKKKILPKLSNIFNYYKYVPRKKVTNITTPNQFLIKSFDLKYSSGSPMAIVQDIVNWTNRNNNTFVKTRINITTATGYQLNTGLISGNVTLNDILDKLDLEYPDFDIRDATIIIRFYGIPSGGSSGGVKISKWLLEKKKSTVLIENDDDLCGQRALMLGLLKNKDDRSNIRRKTRTNQYYKNLDKVCSYMGVKKLTFLDMEKFIIHNTKYNITIISDFYTTIYETHNDEAEETIYLFYDKKIEHYHLITNIESFMNNSEGDYKYCFDCKKRMYKTAFKNHKCTGLKCNLCHCSFDNKNDYFKHMNKAGTSDNCPHCNIKCRGAECLHNHVHGNGKLKGCDGKSWFYDCCFKKYINEGLPKQEAIKKAWGRSEDKEHHKCDYKFCNHCQEYLPIDHRCFIKEKEIKDKGLVNLVAFDFESWIDEEGNHKVMYIVSMERLTNKINIWEGKDSLKDFINWCLDQKNTTFIAHNGKSYDTWLIHYYILNNMNKRPDKLILAGQKIMYMKFKSNCFIDSLNHFSCPLDAVPQTFGLDTSKFKKGFYPYVFNTAENWDYIGPIPEIKFFNANGMKEKKRNEFYTWYKEMKDNNYEWNHRKETKEYCISDVKILLEGCNVYSKLGYDLTGVDPLSKQTIASWVLNTYLSKFYDSEKNPIGVLNKDEYDFIKRGFHGGRTECIRLYREWSKQELHEGKCGKYVDIQSLYPTTQFYDKLPYDIPEWVEFGNRTINENNKIVSEDFGFFEVDIEMNKDLFISPLVNKGNGKLEASVENKTKMVYFSEELKQAVKDGCNITKIHKLLRFKYTTNLFKDFVSTFLEIKVNASGKPKFWNQQNKRKKFIDYHYKEFGFRPDPQNERNEGLRSIAKLILNSLWGKFGQRPDMLQSEYISADKIKDWWRLLALSDKKLVDIKCDEISGDYLFVRYLDNREERNNTLKSTNIAIAASVTANAGMRLYKEMRQLGKRVLYHDTDSIIYEYEPDKYNIKEGDYLGEWECETDGKKITKYCSIGPKSYAYDVEFKPKDCKMKGICLNYDNSQLVNINTFKNLVDDSKISYYDNVLNKVVEKEKLITNNNLNFKKSALGISTEIFTKEVNFTMDKRDRLGYWTYPKGYNKNLI